ncbi:MAG: hypothetical protein JKY37_31715 [Nannocystaceae bacterium]|nr:hypothetical protein [Nannocystaceae bacterium]
MNERIYGMMLGVRTGKAVVGGALALTLAAGVGLPGCQRQATEQPGAGGAPVAVNADDAGAYVAGPDDAGPDDSGSDEFDDPDVAMAVVSADGTPTEVITFDNTDPNPGPTERVASQPERPPNGSMLTPDVLSGPK